MTTETPAAPANASMANLLAAMRSSDSIELKLTVPTASHRATIATLPLDPVETQPRQVFFFDTPDLKLNQAGVVVRARRIQGGRGDTVVKLRPVVPAELPPELRQVAAPSTSRWTCCRASWACAPGRSRARSAND